MKTKLLPLLLSSTLIFAACGQDDTKKNEENKTETKTTETKTTESKSTETKSTEKTADNTDAKAIIEKAQERGASVKSYHANLTTDMQSGSDKNTVKMDMSVDESDKTKITMDMANKTMELYIFDKKIVLTQDGKIFVDATEAMGADVKKQLDQLDYNSALDTLNAYKDGTVKETSNGFEITKSFKGLDEFKKLSEATGSKDITAQMKDQLKDINGNATISFNKDYMMTETKTDIDLKLKDRAMQTKTIATYDKYNQVKSIEIPEGAKKPQTIEELKKSQAGQ